VLSAPRAPLKLLLPEPNLAFCAGYPPGDSPVFVNVGLVFAPTS